MGYPTCCFWSISGKLTCIVGTEGDDAAAAAAAGRKGGGRRRSASQRATGLSCCHGLTSSNCSGNKAPGVLSDQSTDSWGVPSETLSTHECMSGSPRRRIISLNSWPECQNFSWQQISKLMMERYGVLRTSSACAQRGYRIVQKRKNQ